MLFNSTTYVVFLAVCFLVVWLLRNQQKKIIVLILASYFFFIFDSGKLIVILLFTTLLDYYIGLKIAVSQNQRSRKIYLITSLSISLGILSFFKYVNFGILSFNSLFVFLHVPFSYHTLEVILPIAISFYTFETMSYIIDVYRRKIEPCRSLLKFMLFMAFFPKLIAGPIMRAYEFLPQLEKPFQITTGNSKIGISYILQGLIKKVVVADNLAVLVDHVFQSPAVSSLQTIIGAIAFGIQIYCDFSGYSDIAVGSAKLFGINLSMNFNKPYSATSPADFWKRWHITLSSWLKDYLYIPLGGNRKGRISTYRNILITMLLGGLWHGASMNFLLWGTYWGILLVGYHIIRATSTPLFNYFREKKIGIMLSWLVTQYLIFLGWILFRVHDVSSMRGYVESYLFMYPLAIDYSFFINYIVSIFLIFAFILFSIFSRKSVFADYLSAQKMLVWGIYIVFILLLISLFVPGTTPTFLYFQF